MSPINPTTTSSIVKASRKKRRPLGVGAPKRAMTAFFYFGSERRAAIKEANPSYAAPEIAKALGKLWQALSDADKAPYQAKTAADKIRYHAEKGNYVYVAPPVPKAKRKRDPNAPKRALTSYLYFCAAKRAEISAKNPGLKVPEIGKLLGAEWRALEERSTYTALSDRDKVRYADEMSRYTA